MQELSLDEQLDRDSAALAVVWLDPRRLRDEAERLAQPIVDAAQARGDGRVAWLSLGMQAMHMALAGRRNPDRQERLAAIQQAFAVCDWPRARHLVEMALAFVPEADAATMNQTLARLDAITDPALDNRPAGEQACTELVRGLATATLGRFDEAIESGVRQLQLAERAGAIFLQTQARSLLSFVLLSVGDVEQAAEVTRANIDGSERVGIAVETLQYNLLLALVIGERWDEAGRLLDAAPVITEEQTLKRWDVISDLLALVRMHQGDAASAQALLARPFDPQRPLTAQLAANRAWMRARVLLMLGRPRDAIASALDGLERVEASHAVLSPMNGTQIYRVLADAHEAVGELGPALEALKHSQDACVRWVRDSVRARLHRLMGDGSVATTPPAHRLQALDMAAQAAHDDLAQKASDVARQRRFLSDVTHEMRNPLHGVIGMTSLLMLSDLDGRQRKLVDLAHGSAQMLLSLCNDVLDLTRLDIGQFRLDLQPVDVAALLDEVTQLMRPMASAAGSTLVAEIHPGIPVPLESDGLRLRQVLMNLLNNACRYAPRSDIRLLARWVPGEHDGAGMLELNVADNGPGLTAESRARFFEEFSRSAAADGRPVPGSLGLGLALCRRIVELMGGTIEARSAPGDGTSFQVRLPIRAGRGTGPAAADRA